MSDLSLWLTLLGIGQGIRRGMGFYHQSLLFHHLTLGGGHLQPTLILTWKSQCILREYLSGGSGPEAQVWVRREVLEIFGKYPEMARFFGGSATGGGGAPSWAWWVGGLFKTVGVPKRSLVTTLKSQSHWLICAGGGSQ